ncbi:hypothetical protein MTYP_02292 [Methylophilaceae bacterium]|nr:hypothetical protein MTYP_02292 [Methylophilaceae bacterium]
MPLDEQEIQFKKRARRRLVGAIALVLLMVTILPMILDDRSSTPPQQEIAITIPGQDDEEFTSRVVPVEPLPESGLQEIPSDSKPETATGAAPGQVKTDDAGTARTAPERTEKTVKPLPAAGTKTETAANKPASTAAKPVEAQSSYLIQIGVFSDAANVRQLEQKLQAKGFKSYTEKLQTDKGEKIRLRTGPFASRAEAEKALAVIHKAGLSGMIITNK